MKYLEYTDRQFKSFAARVDTWAAKYISEVPFDDWLPLVIEGNTKTGIKGRFGRLVRTKGLPLHDCPFATKACAAVCYALIKDQLWNAGKWDVEADGVTPIRLHAGHFVPRLYSYLARYKPRLLMIKLSRDLATLMAKYPDEPFVFRIHEAGDIANLLHMEGYIHLARVFPAVVFYGYTRSFADPVILEAYLRAGLPNLKLRQSTDEDFHERLHPDVAQAFFGPKELEPARKFFCPEQITRKAAKTTGGKIVTCIDCGGCWKTSVDLVLNIH